MFEWDLVALGDKVGWGQLACSDLDFQGIDMNRVWGELFVVGGVFWKLGEKFYNWRGK